MDESGAWFRFAVGAFATWRMTHLLVAEDGPWGSVAALRRSLGSGPLGALIDCFHCSSVWVAVPFAWFVTHRPLEAAVSWLALSGVACLMERLGTRPLAIHPMNVPLPSAESQDELLR